MFGVGVPPQASSCGVSMAFYVAPSPMPGIPHGKHMASTWHMASTSTDVQCARTAPACQGKDPNCKSMAGRPACPARLPAAAAQRPCEERKYPQCAPQAVASLFAGTTPAGHSISSMSRRALQWHLHIKVQAIRTCAAGNQGGCHKDAACWSSDLRALTRHTLRPDTIYAVHGVLRAQWRSERRKQPRCAVRRLMACTCVPTLRIQNRYMCALQAIWHASVGRRLH
jgi:hypothetical protein